MHIVSLPFQLNCNVTRKQKARTLFLRPTFALDLLQLFSIRESAECFRDLSLQRNSAFRAADWLTGSSQRDNPGDQPLAIMLGHVGICSSWLLKLPDHVYSTRSQLDLTSVAGGRLTCLVGNRRNGP
jgi:hypothetical protein